MSELNIIRGDDEVIDLTLVTADGDPANLTGVDLWFTVKESAFDPDILAIVAKTNTDGITVVGQPTAGLATVAIDAADTKQIRSRYLSKSLYWDVQLKDITGAIQTVAQGTIVISPDVTHATEI